MKKWVKWIIVGFVLLTIIGAVTGEDEQAKSTPKGVAAKGPSATPTPTPEVELKLSDSKHSYTTRQKSVKVAGTVQPSNAKVTVNDKRVKTDVAGYFSKTVKLSVGNNNIEVYGWAAGHHDSYEHVKVKRKLTLAQLRAKRIAAAEKRAAEAAAAEARKIQKVIDFKANAQTIPYNQLNKNADKYSGEHVKYYGQILQIQESGGEGFMLLSVTDLGYGIYDDNVWVNYNGSINGAEEDMVTIYGTVVGSKSYDTQIGGETYVPEIDAKYIEE